MKYSLLALLCGVSLANVAQADTLYGLYADANYWHAKSDNTVQVAENAKETLKNKTSGQLAINASLEHGVPLLPNVRVRHVGIKATQKDDADVKNDIKSTDVIAYYEVLDNVVSVDVGLGAKRIDGSVNVMGKEYLNLDKTLPMAYASVGAKLPFTGLSAKAELGLAQGHQASAKDASAEIKYDFIDKALVDVGVKAGYRILNVKNDKVAYPSFDGAKHPFEANFKGPYVGVEVHF